MICTLPPVAEEYLQSVLSFCVEGGFPLASVIVLGSVITPSFTPGVSDVDLILVLQDGATKGDRRRLHAGILGLEVKHHFRPPPTPKTALESFVERTSGYAMSSFICTRTAFLSRGAAGLFGLNPVEALFVDRIVYANVVSSALTLWGEDLLPSVTAPPVRRLDVFKALFNFFGAVASCAVWFGALPLATQYAMGVLKHSLHACYSCYHGRTAPLHEEIDFFTARLGPNETLRDLQSLRQNYRPSYRFVVRCLPLLVRLHFRTARENSFQR